MTTANAVNIAELLDALRAWLNGGGDLDEFAADQGVTVDDVSDSWNTYFSADFSRDYDLDTTQTGGPQSGGGAQPQYTPQPPPHTGDPQVMKEYILQEVHNYQEFTTVNNIEDNSFNQQIIAGGDVHQDLDIDNSDNIAEDGGVIVRDSTLDDSNIVTGNDNVVDSEDVLDGDVTTTAGPGGQAQSGINFGEGDLQQNQQDQDVDVTTTGNNTGGDGGSADGTGGAGTGGDGSGSADGGDGGNGGFNPYLHDPIPTDLDGGPGGDGGDGGWGTGVGGNGTGGAGTGGHGGDGGDAGHDVDVHVTQDAPDFL